VNEKFSAAMEAGQNKSTEFLAKREGETFLNINVIKLIMECGIYSADLRLL
jgi:hypothetical protein